MGKVDLQSLPEPPLSKALLLFPIITSTCIDLNKTQISRLYNDRNSLKIYFTLLEKIWNQIEVLKILKTSEWMFYSINFNYKICKQQKGKFWVLKKWQDNCLFKDRIAPLPHESNLYLQRSPVYWWDTSLLNGVSPHSPRAPLPQS